MSRRSQSLALRRPPRMPWRVPLGGILALLSCEACAAAAAPLFSVSAGAGTVAVPSAPTTLTGGALTPIEPIEAPFPMPQLQRPQFPAATFDVRRYGAVPDGRTKNTDAFARAVAAASAAGGGRVVVPPGRWLTSPIHLESHVNLVVQAGAEIFFSQKFTDYLPPVFTRWEGIDLFNYSPLIYAHDCIDVAVTGGGKLDGQGDAWWPWRRREKGGAKRLYELAIAGVPVSERVFGTEAAGLRPSFVQTVNCKNVLIEGVTITNGPMWTIHPVYSENVIIRDVQVITSGANTDGCDPDSSTNVLIEDSYFNTGDDCIVIKSGLNEEGWRVGRPSQNIVVRRVRAGLGNVGVGIGSEMSGGVRNVWIHDCEFKGTDRGLRIKSMRGRGGLVENVWYERVRHEDIRSAVIEVTMFYGSSTLVPRTQAPPIIRSLYVRDVTAVGAPRAIDIIGLPEQPVENVTFRNVNISSEKGVRCVDAKHIVFDGVGITAKESPSFALQNVNEVVLDRSSCTTRNNCVRLAGVNGQVTVDGEAVSSSAALRPMWSR